MSTILLHQHIIKTEKSVHTHCTDNALMKYKVWIKNIVKRLIQLLLQVMRLMMWMMLIIEVRNYFSQWKFWLWILSAVVSSGAEIINEEANVTSFCGTGIKSLWFFSFFTLECWKCERETFQFRKFYSWATYSRKKSSVGTQNKIKQLTQVLATVRATVCSISAVMRQDLTPNPTPKVSIWFYEINIMQICFKFVMKEQQWALLPSTSQHWLNIDVGAYLLVHFFCRLT